MDNKHKQKEGNNMALILKTSECIHCGEFIGLRTYANGSWSKDHPTINLWTSGNGSYPGDQRFCESNIMDDDIGSYGPHEPMESN